MSLHCTVTATFCVLRRIKGRMMIWSPCHVISHDVDKVEVFLTCKEVDILSIRRACKSKEAILTKHFRLPKLSVRRGDQIIYYRDMESIEYFLSYIGAKKAAFDIFNAQMYREKSNEVNRKQNCDLANLTTTVNSSAQHREAISALMESGEIEKLPSELRRTAELRMQHDTISLAELAAMEEPPISKSQVSKRLKKIYDFYIERTAETT